MHHQYTPRQIAGFWSKVDRSGGPGACWEWQGYRTPKGYGRTGGKQAHRIAWELTHGPIPTPLMVCHDCPNGDNRACCNPAHLFLGTQLDNVADAIEKERMLWKLTDDMVREIRRLSSDGIRLRTIAAQFGVSYTLVQGVAAGTRHQRVP